MLVFDGQPALSAFRIDRLNADLARRSKACRVAATRHVYFVAADPAVDVDELTAILQAQAGDPAAASLWIVPRLGTISPWSSKATDILRGCGLAVERVERGMAMMLECPPATGSDAWHDLIAILHDAMTESAITSLDDAAGLFVAGTPAPLERITLGADPVAALAAANERLGLALAADEIAYLADHYGEMQRDPSDAELVMFAQANSEHCRHKVFNADFVLDGEQQPQSLFAMIRNTHAVSPAHTLSAYSDNAAVIEGAYANRFFPAPDSAVYVSQPTDLAYAIKVETHNHPTAIAPFPGAATGAGGEIRDEGATGRGGKPKAGLTGFCVSDLRIPDLPRPWETERALSPRFASAFEIMRDGPIGAASFNNEFGRACLGGYFRSFEQADETGLLRGYDKPIMLAGGLANLRRDHVEKHTLQPNDAVIVLGGPAMLIGLGGGAASSMAGGASSAEVDFASVQRDNPEMQRRCQEVIDACIALGEKNPLVSIHDVGAGGLSNAIPELLNDSSVGGRIDLRAIPSDDAALSPMQIWCNEAQERYVLGVRPDDLARFQALCERERCPYAVVGQATSERRLLLFDSRFPDSDSQHRPIDLPLDVLFGKPPRMQRDSKRAARRVDVVPDLSGIGLDEAIQRVLRFPCVGSKSFLITIGDRSVGGLCSRDPMVGPWQVPVADCAVTLSDFEGYTGEAMAMGERTPIALTRPEAAARMAVGEALTNIVSAGVKLDEIRLSANWMAAVSHPGEDAALYDAVHAIGMQLCPALGIAIPVGKDSMSMQSEWRDGEVVHRCVSPVSPVITAFARVSDVRQALTPQLIVDADHSDIWLIDLGAGSDRLGGSALLQVFDRGGGLPPDVDDPEPLRKLFALFDAARAEDMLLACHDRSDGGALVALIEMAFAGHCGLNIDIVGWADNALQALFNEELGMLVQVRADGHDAFAALLAKHGLDACSRVVARPSPKQRIKLTSGDVTIASWNCCDLMAAWSETSHAMQRRRDNPDSADSENEWRCEDDARGILVKLGFDPADDITAPFIARGARPRIAILRDQGVNGQIEMAAAFTRAGFEAVDVHMTDLQNERVRLADFSGLAAGGGFSYGDVLGAGRGWAASILHNDLLRNQFEAFFADAKRFALGVCNGCQMLSQLKDLIPGATHWPQFVRNASEQYEARLVTVEVMDSPSILFRDMAGSRIPVVVAHGEGCAQFAKASDAKRAGACLRFVDARGKATEQFPLNPNGSAGGLTGFTAADGRVTALMPHPERVFRSVQMSWRPSEWGEDSPWMRMFRNARVWLD